MNTRILFLFLALLTIKPAFSQDASSNSQGNNTINIDEINTQDAKRVEIQRYIGYENLLLRYLTLPYDISANGSNQGRYFDIGYIIFAILPLSFLLVIYNRKKIFYSTIGLLLFYLGISYSTTFMNVNTYGPISIGSSQWKSLTINELSNSSEFILFSVFSFLGGLTKPLNSLLNNYEFIPNHLSYIIIFFLFVGTFYLVKSLFNAQKEKIILISILLGFSLLWLLLSGGIIWYGFFAIPLLIAFAVKNIPLSMRNVQSKLLFASIGPIPIVIWIACSFAARVSNLNQLNYRNPDSGYSLVHPNIMYYTTALQTEQDLKITFFKDDNDLFNQINSNNDIVYMVGTSLAFDIKNNAQRIYHDNSLLDFFNLLKIYRDKHEFVKVLKTSGIRYIVIDLYTHTLDKTPEQGLTKKFQLLLNTVYDNDSLRLLGTDRVMQISGVDGSVKQMRDVFGIKNDPSDKISIKEFGSYAVYEII